MRPFEGFVARLTSMRENVSQATTFAPETMPVTRTPTSMFESNALFVSLAEVTTLARGGEPSKSRVRFGLRAMWLHDLSHSAGLTAGSFAPFEE